MAQKEHVSALVLPPLWLCLSIPHWPILLTGDFHLPSKNA
jgi:hypothetical protein